MIVGISDAQNEPRLSTNELRVKRQRHGKSSASSQQTELKQADSSQKEGQAPRLSAGSNDFAPTNGSELSPDKQYRISSALLEDAVDLTLATRVQDDEEFHTTYWLCTGKKRKDRSLKKIFRNLPAHVNIKAEMTICERTSSVAFEKGLFNKMLSEFDPWINRQLVNAKNATPVTMRLTIPAQFVNEEQATTRD